MRLVLTIAAGLSAAAFLLGCTGQVAASGEAADAEATSGTAALLVVSRTATNDSSSAEAVAQFIKLSSRARVDEALRAVGATIDLPATGSCAALTSAPEASRASVQLLNVGRVAVRANGVETALQEHQLPILDTDLGVNYARRMDTETFPAGAPYLLRVSGQEDVGAFDVSAVAPADPEHVRAEAGEASIELTWDASSGAEDVVYVDVVSPHSMMGRGGSLGLRCALADTGRASIAGAFESGTIYLHRVHSESFRARGIDSGEIRFDFARVLGFSRR